LTVPEWIYDSIVYQVFPDRFANGDPKSDPPNVQGWGSTPTIWGFQGGDLEGVRQNLSYLQDLGVNTIYFNPIFLATSNHRYNTTDYYKIDPKLGTNKTFIEFLNHAHEQGFRVVLDGVFNHCGRGFFAFNDVLENGEHSAYKDWFHLSRLPPRAYGNNKAIDYLAWWDFPSLPKFNTSYPPVREFIFGVARYWIEQGIDGWRLDVPNEIDDDDFWGEFRRVVKESNPEAFLVGEIWTVDPRWVGSSHFDGLMNYPVRDALLGYFVEHELDSEQFDRDLLKVVDAYPDNHLRAHLLTIGSHDTVRLRTACRGEGKLQRLIHLFQFCFPGVPTIFYGDEIGLEGGEDPDCRKAFDWDPEGWDHATRDFVKDLISLRKRHAPLRYGEFRSLQLKPPGSYGFVRSYAGETLMAVFNSLTEAVTLTFQVDEFGWATGFRIVDQLSQQSYHVGEAGLVIDLAPQSGALLSLE
jgi:glycosidase